MEKADKRSAKVVVPYQADRSFGWSYKLPISAER